MTPSISADATRDADEGADATQNWRAVSAMRDCPLFTTLYRLPSFFLAKFVFLRRGFLRS
jgi:hypothetical protein